MDGDEKKAREMYDADNSVLNTTIVAHVNGHQFKYTGLKAALIKKRHSICRWLLSLPDIIVTDVCSTSAPNSSYVSALRCAAYNKTPLDLIISLTRLSRPEIKTKDQNGNTALDIAVEKEEFSTAIYLSWLGAECKEENRKFRNVTLQTWLDAGCQQDAPLWAVAANNLEALRELATMKEVFFDKPLLLDLANVLGHQEIKCYLEDNECLKIYCNQVFCDFEISFKERTFPCHKIFIANQSKPFQALVEDKLRQNLPMKTELLNCPNEAVAESFIKFFYIGVIDKDLLHGFVVSFLHLSDFYQVNRLQTTVEDAMIVQLGEENVKEFLIAADMYHGERIKAAAIEYLRENKGIWGEKVEEWKPFISRELLCELVIKLI